MIAGVVDTVAGTPNGHAPPFTRWVLPLAAGLFPPRPAGRGIQRRFFVNADSSQYHGIEARYDWRPATGLRLSGAYTHIDAKYTNFSDQVNTAAGFLVRDGKNVPNVPTDILNSKIAYDHGPTGWGAWVEGNYYNSYFLNNSNTFSIPSYVVANVNIHKNFELNHSSFRFVKIFWRWTTSRIKSTPRLVR